MKSPFNRVNLGYLFWGLLIAAVVKTGWFVVETAWLAFTGVDYVAKATKKPLFYTSHFASAAPPAVKRPTPSKPKKSHEIKQMKLLAIYHSQDNDVATILYQGKTKVIARGEKVGTYTLKSGGIDFAVFERNGQTYTLRMQRKKSKSTIAKYFSQAEKTDNNETVPESKEEIIFDGTRHIVPRETLNKYTKDLKAVYRNIGLNEVRKNGKIEGFKVTFIRKSSLFSQLGLQRGDVLTAINGQPLDGLKAAFDAYRNINDMTSMTLQVKRGNQTMELEYEID